MSIALIGATGYAGSRILAELTRRGHIVTAIVRHPEHVPAAAGVTAVKGDANSGDELAGLLRGHEAVISSLHFLHTDLPALIAAIRTSGVPRWLIVGGAGSLYVAPGLQLLDAPAFPAEYRPEAGRGREFLDLLKMQTDLDWTFLSPSAEFVPGERTCRFRLGGNDLLADAEGRSRISVEDFAVALVDELETPRHTRQRFTVGY